MSPPITPYIPMSVQPYVSRAILPTRGTIEVLRRQSALLDNLGAEVNIDHQNQGTLNKRECNPHMRHKRSPDLPPRPNSSRYIRAHQNNDQKESLRHREARHKVSIYEEDNQASYGERERRRSLPRKR